MTVHDPTSSLPSNNKLAASSLSFEENEIGRDEIAEKQFQLFEETLVTKKRRVKTGEVRISKQIVTSTGTAAIPVTKEKIVIEIESIYGADTRLNIGEAVAAKDGSITMDIYEDQATVCREVKPYQSISVRKEVVNDVVTAEETLRREEMTIETDGTPQVREI